jgi:hypothetical protein
MLVSTTGCSSTATTPKNFVVVDGGEGAGSAFLGASVSLANGAPDELVMGALASTPFVGAPAHPRRAAALAPKSRDLFMGFV